MKYLLDTNVLYRAFYQPELLTPQTHAIIHAAEAIFISAASIWEIAIKVRIGKLNADPTRILAFLNESGFQELPVFARHTLGLATLPLLHNDPFDRILIVQAMAESLHLVTTDTRLKPYSNLVLCV